MPRINFFENDNTGAVSAEDLAVVFVPGTVQIKSGLADAYNCVYIPSSATNLLDYFNVNIWKRQKIYGIKYRRRQVVWKI